MSSPRHPSSHGRQVGPLVALTAGVLFGLAGCGGSSSPAASSPGPTASSAVPAGDAALCGDLTALGQSTDDLRGLTLTKDSIRTASTTVGTMKQQLDKLAMDARSRDQPRVAQVQAAFAGLQTSVAAAGQAPGSAAFTAVRTSLAGVTNSLDDLRQALAPGC